MASLSRYFADFYAKTNEVSIKDLLTAIAVFHEWTSASNHLAGHFHIELYEDGSGCVTRDSRFEAKVFSFNNLKELVAKSKEIIFEYNIEWED